MKIQKTKQIENLSKIKIAKNLKKTLAFIDKK